MLGIIYQDEYLVAINKPHGLLVHQSSIARDAEEFALQLLKNQIGRFVWPCHRLDRKTSGLLIFALDKNTEKAIQLLFRENKIRKKYLAIVRGHTPDEMTIDYPLTKENGTVQEAITNFRTLRHTEIDIPFGKYQTSRYSLVEAEPHTGRMHQLRKHFAHINHPIIGDRPHGCNKQNKLFKEKWQMDTMLLHASELEFEHPTTKEKLILTAEPHAEFTRISKILKLPI